MELTPVTRIEQFLQQIIDNGGGGGGGGGGGTGGDGVLVVSLNTTTGTLNKTWREIRTAMETSVVLVTIDAGVAFEHMFIIRAGVGNTGIYYLEADSEGSSFITESENGYPTFAGG